MARKKHQPQRTCIVCRTVHDKRALVRLVRTPEGTVIIDPTGKANGRGAYLCQNPACWERGLHKKVLANALKTTLSTENVETLRTYLQTELTKT